MSLSSRRVVDLQAYDVVTQESLNGPESSTMVSDAAEGTPVSDAELSPQRSIPSYTTSVPSDSTIVIGANPDDDGDGCEANLDSGDRSSGLSPIASDDYVG